MTDITIQDLAKAFKDHSGDVTEGFRLLQQKASEADARLSEMEQKAARGGYGDGGASEEIKSLGQKYIEQDGLKDFAENGRNGQKFDWETKATITTSTANAAGSAGAALQAFRDPTITPLPQRRPVV
ncbi:hypothetical protein OB03_12545, partial [Brevundimonas sp. GN22]